MNLDAKELCKRVCKYVLEGLVVAFAAIVLPNKKPDLEAAFALALVAAATFAILDLFAPNNPMSGAVRQGVGFGIGANLVGFPRL
tara:strand:+ start:211 stop:465 length:255 start_codon:yes stop_codon:yes gene_type:complete